MVYQTARKFFSYLLIFTLLYFILSCFYSSYRKGKTLKEIEKLNPDKKTIDAIELKECKSLEKHNDYWIVDDCKDEVYFKIFLTKEGYYLGYCSYTTPGEALVKFSNLIGRNCTNLETIDMTPENFKNSSLKLYLVCGKSILFQDNCIIGVGEVR